MRINIGKASSKMPIKTIADLMMKLNSSVDLRSSFTSVLCGLDREIQEGFNTMAVTLKNGYHRLIIGSTMTDLVSDPKNHVMVGLIFCHELIHITQGHVSEMLRILSEMETDEEKEVFQKIVPLSVDYAANSIGLKHNLWTMEQFLHSPPLDDDGVGIYKGVLPSDMGLTFDLSFREYFQILWDLHQKDTPPPNWPGMPGEGDLDPQQKVQSAKDYIDRQSNPYGHIGDFKEALEGLSDEELEDLVSIAEAAEASIKRDVVDTMIRRGYGSSSIVTHIKESLKPPSRDWRALLLEFVEDTKANGDDPTSTNIKPSLSMLDLVRKSEFMLAPFPGTKKRPVWTIGVFIDTSGSVSNDMLHTFFSEMRGLVEAGTELLVIHCDSFITHVEEIGVGEEVPAAVYGRGGTSFDPPFRYILEEGIHVDMILYFTDGGAPLPRHENRVSTPTLWCIAKGGCIPGAYGTTKHLEAGVIQDLEFGKALLVGL